MPTQAGCCCGDPVRGLSSVPQNAVEGPVLTRVPRGGRRDCPPTPDGSSTCQEPCDQELEVRRGGSWLVGLGVALLKAAGHRPWGLEGGATCTLTFLPLFPCCSLACRASLLAAPPRGVLSRVQTPTPYWAREGALFGVITPQCQLLGLHCSRDTAACARPHLTALGLPCRLSASLGECTARAFGI